MAVSEANKIGAVAALPLPFTLPFSGRGGVALAFDVFL